MLELISKTRTYRRFDQSRGISDKTLEGMVNLARLGGSARNCQPWQYTVINTPETCARIFPYLAWAGYLTDWKGPEEGERPSAYILCLLNRTWLKGNDKEAQFDLGIASQNMLLGAMEQGIGACRIGAFSPKLANIFDMPADLELSLVIALGYPKETVVVDSIADSGDIKYWRDQSSIHHVPKRSLDDLLVTLPLLQPAS